MEDTVTGLEERLTEAEKKIKGMADGMEDMEKDGSRWDNICILNLKEGMEGKRPMQLCESWLPSVLGLEMSPGTESRITIVWAHRSVGPSGSPRPVVNWLHNSRDKPRIMAALRVKPNLECEGQQIFRTCLLLFERGVTPLTCVYTDREPQWQETQRNAENFLNTLG